MLQRESAECTGNNETPNAVSNSMHPFKAQKIRGDQGNKGSYVEYGDNAAESSAEQDLDWPDSINRCNTLQRSKSPTTSPHCYRLKHGAQDMV